jgi:predicted ribonuclease YlaK
MENKPMKFVVDTNALLLNCAIVDELPHVIVPYAVLEELDRIKMEPSVRGYQARSAVRKLKSANNVEYDLRDYGFEKNDNNIVECAYNNGASIATGDNVVLLKAKANNIETLDVMEMSPEDDYTGWLHVELNEDQLAAYYENRLTNEFELNPNEYVVFVKPEGSILDVAKCDPKTNMIVRIKSGELKSSQLGKFKPKDVYQRMAVDSLMTNQMTMIKGKAGSGKSLASLSYVFHAMENGKNKFDKLIVFVNPVAARNAEKLGYYSGDKNDKLLQGFIGNMLGSKFGGIHEVNRMIGDGKLVILPASDIRGYDTTGMNSVIYLPECQNYDIDLLRLACERVGPDCSLILDGDYSRQVDSTAFEGSRNGMRRVSEIFRGADFYGEIELPNVYRSKIADLAQSM